MALPTIIKSKFPNVPDLPGVPALARSASVVTKLSTKLLQQSTNALTVASFFNRLPVWGVYNLDGNLIIEPDTIMDFNYIDAVRISAYPVQAGAFANFNRVNNPDEIILRFFKAGSELSREGFLRSISNAIASTDLVNIITPERSYRNMNPVRQEVTRREREGAYMVDVDVTFEEVRTVSAQYDTVTENQVIAANTTNAQSSSAVPATNTARVQAKLPGTVGHRPDGSIVSKIPKTIAVPSEQ